MGVSTRHQEARNRVEVTHSARNNQKENRAMGIQRAETRARIGIDTAACNFDVITVTPQQAQTWLDEHDNYRRLSQRRAAAYANAMGRRLWFVGPPLVFDNTGQLIDGQTRLKGVVLHGEAVDFSVMCGVDPKSRPAFDNNQVRSAIQILPHEISEENLFSMGITKVSSKASNILRSVLLLPHKGFSVVLNSELIAEYERYGSEVEEVASWFVGAPRGISTGPVCAAFVRALLWNPIHKDTLRICAVEMCSFEFRQSPNARKLAKFLATTSSSISSNQARQDVYFRVAYTLSAEMLGKAVYRILKADKDPFPLVP